MNDQITAAVAAVRQAVLAIEACVDTFRHLPMAGIVAVAVTLFADPEKLGMTKEQVQQHKPLLILSLLGSGGYLARGVTPTAAQEPAKK